MYPKRPSSGFFWKLFHWWFVCCVPPLIEPKSVVTLGPVPRQIRVQTPRNRFQSVGRLVRQGSPSALSTSSKVRRPQFAATGREAAPRIHNAARSAAWHTHARGVIRGTGCDWGWVDCRRGCRATSLFRSVGKGGEERREGERGRGGGRERERGKKGGRTGMERQALFPISTSMILSIYAWLHRPNFRRGAPVPRGVPLLVPMQAGHARAL